MNPVRNLTAAAMADPLHQTINLIRADGLSVAVDLSIVDMDRTVMVSTSIAYGVEIGASLVMLAVILTMTPKTKFWRLPTYLNIASLCNNVVRVMLLALYFDSSWVTFYTLYALDDRYVSKTDVAITVASTIFSLPQNILVMSALMLQAWSMVKLWPRFYKWGILCFSVVLVLFEIGFRGASMAYGMMQVNMSPQEAFYLMNRLIWVRQYFLGLEVACICWFCFLFISKLATHLWKNRSFLPTTKGLGAMDALVMTNGVLMLIPVFFASLQYYLAGVPFEAGSMVYTSVIIVLPLGTLVAQRIADPAAFNSQLNGTARISNNAHDRFQNYSDNKKALLLSTSTKSSKGSTVFSGRRPSSHALYGQIGVSSMVSSGGPISAVDIELARIDADIETGQVRVDREIQRSEETRF